MNNLGLIFFLCNLLSTNNFKLEFLDSKCAALMSSKKWTKKAVKEKVDYPTLFADEAAMNEALKFIKNSKCITHTQICERLRVSVALAKRVMRQLVKSGDFAIVSKSSRMTIFKNMTKKE